MKAVRWLVIGVLAAASYAGAQERQSATVIRQGAGGELQVLSTETTVPAGGAAVARPAPAGAEAIEEAPRKARIIVAPAVFAQERRRRIDRELNERFGITDAGMIESPGYTSYIVDALVNVRKFDVLEREELKALLKEIEFGESEFVDLAKVVKVGNMMGADYVVLPEIRYLEVSREERQVPYVSQKQVVVELGLGTNIRTVDIATGRIIGSNIDKIEKKDRERSGENARVMVAELIADAFRESALREAANLVDVAYPIRVISIHDGYVMLNRGRGAILKGEILKVFEAGEMMVDPDTKESLGYQEAYVGKLEVTDVDQKTSKARIVETMSPIQRLAICRRETAPTTAEAPKAPAPAPKID